MKEHYVSYEQAVALKRLGFAEKVNHGYLKKISIEPDLSYGEPKEVHSKCPKNYNDNRKGADKGLFFYSAPRLDQAAAWIREEKGIFVGVTYDNNMSNYNPYGFRVQIPMCNDRSALGFHEYNHASSAGIDKAI
ncbi:MAG: hypothetical protein K2N25_03390 [Muribaculaceae bacterium]|nr:hypothetical protein [Muribaculaceae bacterium]